MNVEATTTRLRRFGIVVVACASLAAAFSSCSSSVGEGASPSTTEAPSRASTTLSDGEPTDTEPAEVTVEATIDSLNAFWSGAAADLGFAYDPLDRSRVTDGNDGATCDGARVIDDPGYADNASASTCSEGLIVYYDPAYLEVSPVRIQGTLAHEWGHIVQFQNPDLDAGTTGFGLDSELQADCMLGAWTADNYVGVVDDARQDLGDIGDPDEVGIEEEDAHGRPEERIAAFDLGLAEGPSSCFDERFDAILPG